MAIRVDERFSVTVGLQPEAVLGLPVAPHASKTRSRVWIGKRSFDIIWSIVLIVVLTPLLLSVAALIKLSSRGPVIFRHRRVGRDDREFGLLKFRSMCVDAEQRLYSKKELLETYLACDHKLPHSSDPRLTPIGRVLRRSSLDELPQLFNVLVGDMSLVGPRPVERAQLRQYGYRRHCYIALRPGLTGIWQVSGRNKVNFPKRAELDEDYFSTCSPWTDLKILFRTPRAVLKGLNED